MWQHRISPLQPYRPSNSPHADAVPGRAAPRSPPAAARRELRHVRLRHEYQGWMTPLFPLRPPRPPHQQHVSAPW
ncbi:hypothetical protein E2C01_027114 [Portunus trituberculatus]|uniref:Uncharacterized protein n=1 Tax=Portunus trituberculatus TaxID=210409 RepID=A0A5B7EL37_PORTR|nr:hypothetical protein [Portunus trituberculatus]